MTDAQGQRQVREIVAVPGRVEGDIVELEHIFRWNDGLLERAHGYPPHRERFIDRSIDVAQILDVGRLP
jgi:pilus assembly protein CpaF